MVQDHWALMDYKKNISLIGSVKNKGNKEIIGIGTYARMDDQWVEVAFVVREDFQGHGVAAYLFKELEKVAAANGFIVFLPPPCPRTSQ